MERVPPPKSPLCIAYGDDDFRLDAFISMARGWPNRVVRMVHADNDVTEEELLDELEMGTTDGLVRTIVFDNAQRLKESKAKVLRVYADAVRSTDFSIVLVAIVRATKLPELWAYVGSKGKIFAYPKLKALDWDNEVLDWVRGRAKRLLLEFEVGVDLDLCRRTGGDLYRLDSELRKLVLLASTSGSRRVTAQWLDLVVSPCVVIKPWDVADAAFLRNRKLAMDSFSSLYRADGESSALSVTDALIRKLQEVIVARHMIDSGAPSDDVAMVLGMSPIRCSKYFLPQVVKKHNPAVLAKYTGRLCRLDQHVKGSSRSKRTLVELTLLSITG